jgi:hypothetical protein
VTGEDDLHEEPAPPPPWHQSTPAVVGASIAGLAAIALVIAGVVFVTRQADKPQDAPLNYVDPTFSATATHPAESPPTTTETIASTSPPVTTDINPSSASPTPTTPPSETSSSEPPSTSETDDQGDGEPSTTRSRSRPRTNVTRTLYPLPGN